MTAAFRDFSFHRRPTPVPGDLRISWRLSVILMMIGYSRSARASVAKLYILNDAIRSDDHSCLEENEKSGNSRQFTTPRIEPAFARAIDYLVGEKLAVWVRSSGRAALQLTPSGVKAATAIANMKGTLDKERRFLERYSKELTETRITQIIGQAGKSA